MLHLIRDEKGDFKECPADCHCRKGLTSSFWGGLVLNLLAMAIALLAAYGLTDMVHALASKTP